MPVNIKIKGIFPPKNVMSKKGDAVFVALRNTLKGEVADRVKSAMKRRTENWASAPVMKDSYRELATRLVLTVEPFGRGKSKWVMLSLGVPEHPIGPRRKKFLFIRGGKGGYKPHTTAGGGFGGPGSYGSNNYYTQATFIHPGVKARKFEDFIIKDEEAGIREVLRRAVERATR